MAACHMFGQMAQPSQTVFPYGIYTIPEMSMIGQTEQTLTAAALPYEVGIARYREIARGQLINDPHGVLKLLFHPDSHRLLGVHAIGTGATELIHIGQAVMAAGMPIDYFVETVFNYPTLAECYKVAAYDGINRCRLRANEQHEDPIEILPPTSPKDFPHPPGAPLKPRKHADDSDTAPKAADDKSAAPKHAEEKSSAPKGAALAESANGKSAAASR